MILRGVTTAVTPTAARTDADPFSSVPLLHLEPAEVLTDLGSSSRGLTTDEARRRLAQDGPNELPVSRPRRIFLEVVSQFANMFVVVLVVAAGLTLLTYLWSVPRDSANLILALGIMAVVVLNALIGFFQEHSAERTAQALQAMVPHQARVLRDGELTQIPADQLVRGDLVLLDAGDEVSADCRVVESHALYVEMAALTGESQPVARSDEASLQAREPLESRNCVFMGTSVTNGTGKAAVFATGLDTQFGRIYRLTTEVRRETSPLQRQVNDMARRVALVAIGAGAALFAVRILSGNSTTTSFIFALGVMVALVPEGLPATLSVSLAIAVRRMAQRHALIKRLVAVETLGSTNVICTDKTGTLTKGEMTIQQIYVDGATARVTGIGYSPEGSLDDVAGVRELLVAAGLCCDARLLPPAADVGWRILGDPTEGAILVACAKAGVDLAAENARTPRVGVFPFDADRKIMTTLHQGEGAVRACAKGSPQAILERCTSVVAAGRVVALDEDQRHRVSAANDDMASSALRVLGVAVKTLASEHVDQDTAESELTLLGLVGMLDPPRAEVTTAVDACRRAGVRIFMVTGDYGLTAEAIARRVGIIHEGAASVVTGRDLDEMSDDALVATLGGNEQIVFARVRPEHKLRIVLALESSGYVVAVTGDGANDAPALKRASVGVAMSEGGTDVARAAAEMLLLDDSFVSIAAAIELGRAVYQNIRHILVYLFSHNLAELAPILAATAVGFPLVPLSALQVLAIDLGSDVLPALALGAQPPEAGTMDRPPRSADEHLFSWGLVRRFLFLGTIESLGVVVIFFWRVHGAHLAFADFRSSNPTYREALTMTQAGIVVSQFFNSFTVRTERESVLRAGVFSNPALVAAGVVGLSLMACISYVPVLQRVFNTAALSVTDWLVLLVLGVTLLGSDEVRKALLRHRDTTRQRRAASLPTREES